MPFKQLALESKLVGQGVGVMILEDSGLGGEGPNEVKGAL